MKRDAKSETKGTATKSRKSAVTSAAKSAARAAKPRPAATSAASRPAPISSELLGALAAAEEKKADNIVVLEMDKNSGAFTDYFILCNGSNPRQIQAISDGVEEKLSKAGSRPAHVEGYDKAEWVLLDYVDFVVHVFSPKSRDFYDLERLWKSAKRLQPEELTAKGRSRKPAESPAPASTRSRTRVPKAPQ